MTDNWIVANFQAALDFFNAMMQFLYDILVINPVTYRSGTVWQIVDTIYTSLLGVSISLCVIFFYIGLIQDSAELILHRRWEVILWDFLKFSMMSGLIIYGRYLFLLIFSIGKEFVDAVVLKNGSNLLETTAWIEMPDRIVNATNGLSISSGIVFWVVTLLAAIVVMVSCFSIMLVVYGRLFKIYLHIALSPPFIACSAGKATMSWFVTFLKSFIAVCMEGLIIVVACFIFSAFANGFDIYNPVAGSSGVPEESIEDAVDIFGEKIDSEDDFAGDTADVIVGEMNDITDELNPSNEEKIANAEQIWLYLGETLFLFILMAGVIKGADDMVKRWVGA